MVAHIKDENFMLSESYREIRTYLSINEDEKARRWYKIGSSQGIDYCRRRLKSI